VTKKNNDNKYGKQADVSDVAGVRPSDNFLLVSDNNSMAFMKKYVKNFVWVNGLNALSPEFVAHKTFDRVFVTQQDLSFENLQALAMLNLGTVSIFIEDDRERARLKDTIEAYWHDATAWDFISNVGKVLVTDLSGVQTYER